ncbi:hypothetical protein DYH09_01610 [bacterium CPR1]|nr:hypothetical protein [bacterium CPR1]
MTTLPVDYRERMQSIFYLKQQGRLQEALDQADRLVDEEVDTPDLAVERADTLARLGRPDQALGQLETASMKFPRFSPYGRALHGGLLQHARRLDEARQVFEQLAEEPTVSLAVAKRVADFIDEHGDRSRIPRLLERWASETADWYRLRGRYSPELLKQGLERFPDHEALFEDYVVERIKQEPPETVAEELESLLSLKDHARSLRLRERLAQSLRKLGEPARALELLLECVRRAPANGYYVANAGYVYSELGQTDRALDFLERAIDLRGDDRYAVNAYVKACRDAGQSSRAVEFLQDRPVENRAALAGFLTACRDAGERERARSYIAERASGNRALWGAYARVFKKS